jgi:hypothetical protein
MQLETFQQEIQPALEEVVQSLAVNFCRCSLDSKTQQNALDSLVE